MNKFILYFFFTLFVGCGKQFNRPKEIIPVPDIIREELLKGELIKDKTSLGHVFVGDKIIVEYSGKIFTPKFSDVYEREFPSSWKTRECEFHDTFPHRGDWLIDKGMICHDVTNRGNCRLKYKDYLNDEVTDMKPDSDIRLHYKIGANSYPVGNLEISESMVQESSELFLEVAPMPTVESMPIGFLGYGHCEGHSQMGFSVGGPTASSSHTKEELQEFTVTAILEREVKHGN